MAGLARFQSRRLADPRDRHELAWADRHSGDVPGGDRTPDSPRIRAQDRRHLGHGGEQLVGEVCEDVTRRLAAFFLLRYMRASASVMILYRS